MTLTAEQRTAIACDDDLLLTACPGSGKTRTIAARLAREIEHLRGSPRAAACITYTNAAVQEIEQRIAAQFLDGDERHYIICTIHSFCLTQVLRPFAWLVPGFAGNMRVLTPDRPDFEVIARYAGEQVNFFNLGARDFEAFASLNLDSSGHLIGMALTTRPCAVRRHTFGAAARS